MEAIELAINKLDKYLEKENYMGYDPYDILNSYIPFSVFGKYVQAAAIQIHKRNILNFRPMLGIGKDYNPKGLGLILRSYSLLYKMKPDQKINEKMKFLFAKLIELASKGYSGYCWGYNFRWANPVKILPKYYPSVVVTSFVGKGIFEYYKVTGDPQAREVLISIADFILNDLPISENEHGICFSYTDIIKDCCYNASMLAAEFLSMLYSVTNEDKYLTKSKLAVDFVLAYQKDDGRWNYSIELETLLEDKQIDFHQGFILESLLNFIKYNKIEEKKYSEALLKGAEFYYNNQVVNGNMMRYRYPKIYPIDIHNQAQAIITFSELAIYDSKYLGYAKDILLWTLKEMQQSHKGYFYYRKGKIFLNKIPYIRWSQAWMFLAMTVFKKNLITA